jgi:DNA-binding NarL/FixJ family response regulator
MSVVRVLIADDSDAFRGALHDVVEATPGFMLVGEVASGEAAVAAATTTHPDLVLIDIRMPGMGGVAAGELIAAASPGTAVVMITADSGSSNRFPTADKRSLAPAALIELWQASRRR